MKTQTVFESFPRPVSNIRNMRTFLVHSRQLSWSMFQPRDVWIVNGLCELHIKFMRRCYLQTSGPPLLEANANAKCKLSMIQRQRERYFKQTRCKFVNMQEQIPNPFHPCSLNCLFLKRLTYYNFAHCICTQITYTTNNVVKHNALPWL